MQLRTRHLVYMVLLFSALRAADGSTLSVSECGFGNHYIGTLLDRDVTANWTKASAQKAALKAQRLIGSGHGRLAFLPTGVSAPLKISLPSASLAAVRTPWTMRPPAAHCAALHGVSGSSI